MLHAQVERRVLDEFDTRAVVGIDGDRVVDNTRGVDFREKMPNPDGLLRSVRDPDVFGFDS